MKKKKLDDKENHYIIGSNKLNKSKFLYILVILTGVNSL